MSRHGWPGHALALVLSVTAFGGARAAEAVAIGQPAGALRFQDVWYLSRSLDDLGEHAAYVLLFTTIDDEQSTVCLKHLNAWMDYYGPRDVQFLVVNVGGEDTVRRMSAQALEFELRAPLAKDLEGALAEGLRITHTPAVVLLDGKRRLAYRGLPGALSAAPGYATSDDTGATNTPDRSTGRAPSNTTGATAALDALLAGRLPEPAETPQSGIAIAERRVLPELNVNFAEHVRPILVKHCQSCHRPGTETPFALFAYEDAADHVQAIVEAVRDERMPPWYASFGTFANAPSLSREECDVLTAWAARGCPPGDLSGVPAPPSAPDGMHWEIDTPDLVLETPGEHELPADGYVPYKYVLLPYRFPHDTWIQQCEILPSNPRVVHHCNMAYLENAFDANNAKFILGKVPGVQPMKFEQGVAFRLPKNSLLILQIHYTTTGQPEKCKISVGMRYAREVVKKEFHFLWMVNNTFAIPPGDPLHRVEATNVLPHDAIGVGMFAHMHVRGRDMSFFAHYPDGAVEKLLVIPNYSFDWQLAYRLPDGLKHFPKGTTIRCVSHYDNSTFNPYNPDPTKTVREGQQTFEEMLNGVMFYLDDTEELNLRIDPRTGAVIDQAAAR